MCSLNWKLKIFQDTVQSGHNTTQHTQHITSGVCVKRGVGWSALMVCGVLIALLCSVAPTRDMKSIQRPVWWCTLFSCYDEEVWNKSRTDIFLFMSPTLILTANIQSQGAGQAVCTMYVMYGHWVMIQWVRVWLLLSRKSSQDQVGFQIFKFQIQVSDSSQDQVSDSSPVPVYMVIPVNTLKDSSQYFYFDHFSFESWDLVYFVYSPLSTFSRACWTIQGSSNWIRVIILFHWINVNDCNSPNFISHSHMVCCSWIPLSRHIFHFHCMLLSLRPDACCTSNLLSSFSCDCK